MASSHSHPLMAWISVFMGRVALFRMGYVVVPLEYSAGQQKSTKNINDIFLFKTQNKNYFTFCKI